MKGSGPQIIDGNSIFWLAIDQIQSFSPRLSQATLTVVVPDAGSGYPKSALMSSRQKRRAFESVGFNFREAHADEVGLLPPCENELVIVQRPLDATEILRRFRNPVIDLEQIKPLDYFGEISAAAEVALRIFGSLSPLARAEHSAGRTACIIGAKGYFGSQILGGLSERCERTIGLDIGDDLRAARAADVVISAVGKPHLVEEGFLSPEPILLIDVGYFYDEEIGRAYGDFEPAAYRRSRYYLPTPGGMGPLQILTLLERALKVMGITQYEPWSVNLAR